MSVILASGMRRQGGILSWRPSWASQQDPISKQCALLGQGMRLDYELLIELGIKFLVLIIVLWLSTSMCRYLCV